VFPSRIRRSAGWSLGRVIALVVLVATTLLTGVAPLTAPLAAQAGPSQVNSVGTGPKTGGGTTVLKPGVRVQLPPPSSTPPQVKQGVVPPSHPRPPSPLTGKPLGGIAQAPTTPPTTLPAIGVPSTGGPTDLVAFRNTVLTGAATDEQTSATDEPSVADNGNDVFYTGNFYDALSTDGGQTFGYLNPAGAFPNVFGGFCCDQRAMYVPSWDLTAWAMEYSPDSNNNNEIRLAVSYDQLGLAANEWTYWDFTPPDASLPTGLAFDYPQLAYSANDLYLSVDALNPDGTINAAVIFRCPLNGLASPGNAGLTCTNYWMTGADTFTPVQGATSVMYWADHIDDATLRVFTWPENVDWPAVTWTSVSHSAFPAGPYTCTSPDGTNMCGTDNPIVEGGWLNGSTLGFMWDASQGTGGLGDFPYPYEHVVEINSSSMTLIDEPIIWSPSNSYGFPGVGMNGRGDLGLSLAYSGGSNYPGSAILVRDQVSPVAWQPLNVAMSTNGPPGGRWGDFLSVQPASGNGNTWVGTNYTLAGPCTDNWSPCSSVQPRFLWFGREQDNPFPVCAATPTPSGTPAPRQAYNLFLPQIFNAHVTNC
jgi:hypothetical protein